MNETGWKPATIAARAAGAFDGEFGGAVPGVQPATTFLRDADYAAPGGRVYARDHAVNVAQAEEVLRQLEGAAACRLFPSGVAAVFRALPEGARVVLQSGIYYGVMAWVRGFCARRGLALEEVDAADPLAIRAALARPADLVWIEVPSNPWLKLADIAAIARLTHDGGGVLAVDGTAATPVLTRALELGADLSMHSATKAINGHSDVVAGVLSCRDSGLPVWAMIEADRHDAGAILGPFEAWLLMRGMRTLPLRMERMCANALAIARHLDAHDRIEAVLYPGLPGHPGHEIAARQMCGGSGYLMSVLVRGGRDAALAVNGRLELFQRATSLGGVESLVEHRATIEPHTGIPENLLRLSIGIEDAGDLIADLDRALAG